MKSTQTVYSLQVLRYIAAMLVVVMHAAEAVSLRLPGAERLSFGFGGFGVDIFFVISGFIMAATTDRVPHSPREAHANAWTFLLRRLIRILPMYWLYTTLKVVMVAAVPALALRTQLDAPHVLLSYLMVPSLDARGLAQPVLPVGWTLQYEIVFYLLFAAAIALSVNRLALCLAGFCALFLADWLLPPNTLTHFYAQSIIFEFVLGIAAYRVHQTLRARRMVVGAAALAAGAVLTVIWYAQGPGLVRLPTYGVAAFLLVLGFILLEPAFQGRFVRDRLVPLGDASYSLYLSHSFVVPGTVVAVAMAGVRSPALAMVAAMVASTAVSLLAYRWLELPVHERLTALTRRRAPRPTPPSSMPQP